MPIDDTDDADHVAHDAWKISYSSISWPFPDPDPPATGVQPQLYRLGLAKSSKSSSPIKAPYILQPLRPQGPCSSEDRLRTRVSPELNPGLVGVECAEEVLGVYEKAVGFDVEWDGPSRGTRGERSSRTADAGFSKPQWDALMDELSGSLKRKQDLLEAVTDEQTLFGDWASLDESSVASSSGNDSDMSASFTTASSNSMPSTPRQRNSAFASIVHSTSPSPVSAAHIDVSPVKRLNATASSFIPSPSQTEKPASRKANPPTTFTEFTYPSLSTPPVTVKFRKDEQGFYTGIDDDDTRDSEPPLLPAFLQRDANAAGRRRKSPSSRTRAIIDSLRSRSREPRHALSLNPSPKPSLMTGTEANSISDGERDRDFFDGWINVGGDLSKSDANLKDTRTKELFKALRRHRSDSGAESVSTSTDENGDGGRLSPLSSSTPALSSSSSTSAASISSPSSAISMYSATDGWIEAVTSGSAQLPPIPLAQPQPQQSRNNSKGRQNGHRRRQSSNTQTVSRQQNGKKHNSSLSTPTAMMPSFFPKPPAPTYPVPYHPTYGFVPSRPHPHSHPSHHHSHSHSFTAPAPAYYHYANYPMGMYPNPTAHGYVNMPVQYPGQFGQRPMPPVHPYTQAV